MPDAEPDQTGEKGSSPASRGGAGTYIEGELGALYLLSMLTGVAGHGLGSARIVRVRFQGTDIGYKLDDLVIYGTAPSGDVLLEIQSKRDISFAPKDAVYREVAKQIALSKATEVAEERHLLGIATQRTSRKISGAYQDVLKWAATADNSRQFFERVNAKGVGNDDMREFVSTSRAHFVASGVADEDDAIWRILRRLLILEFDFESAAPLARTYGLMLARRSLADDQAGLAEALWRSLVEISIATGTTGGALDRSALAAKLVDSGFRLAGERDYAPARARLAEMAEMTLSTIGTSVAGVTLSRMDAVGALDDALDQHRLVEIRGVPGVGKSWVLLHLAERIARLSPIIVLDPVGTPPGGWLSFAGALGVPGTASDFLADLASSGGATIFVDSLDMFTDSGRQRTVSELLRAASAIAGFSVVFTGRAEPDSDTQLWLDDTIVDAFGGAHAIKVAELTDAEVALLIDQAPDLKALLGAGHPAARLARNLYRLSRLLKVPSATEIRTEAGLARQWWDSADGAAPDDVRPGQRILAELANNALKGGNGIELASDSGARAHLLRALTLKEIRRDNVDFYHDVLRDWAIGNYIAEDPARLAGLDLSVPVSARVARGIDFAGRLLLEADGGNEAWLDLLAQTASATAHSSWRRQALLAIVRSEAGRELLERSSVELLGADGVLFDELCTAIIAVETVATVDVIKAADGSRLDLPRSFRTNITGSAIWVLRWVLDHADQIPLRRIGAVVDVIRIQLQFLKAVPSFSRPATEMMFGWLRQLDVRGAELTIPVDAAAGRLSTDERSRIIEKLRAMSLVLGEFAPDQLKAYLNEIAAERNTYKAKEVRLYSQVIAPIAPMELSTLILNSLVDPRERAGRARSSDRTFTFADSDYMPPSPAQPPFLILLEAAPDVGLKLIRTLVNEAVSHRFEGRSPEGDGFTLYFDGTPRFFPWADTYLWSRDQAREYSVASGLKALEAWSHDRLEGGESIDAVLADILDHEQSCAAYLLVAIDVLLSHFEKGRDKIGPFVSNPHLLGLDRMRVTHDQMDFGRMLFDGNEPSGKVTLADLKARPSRRVSLADTLHLFLGEDAVAKTVREQLGSAVDALEPYESYSSWVDPRFIGRFARNMLDLSNWTDIGDGKLEYRSPPDEAAHLAQMEGRRDQSVKSSNTEARINLAIDGGEYATAETAGIAVEYAGGDLPDDSDTDVLKSRSTRLITTSMLVARDGDDALLTTHENWVREVIDLALLERSDREGSRDSLRFNRPGLATLALIHLWLRKHAKADRDALVALATRRDAGASVAFSLALPKILEADPRLFKAAMRAALSNCLWRWHSYDEDEAQKQMFDAERAASAKATVEAEIRWLEGGTEPSWPEWPAERPILRRSMRMRVPGLGAADAVDEGENPDEPDTPTNIHINSQAAAQWLAMVNSASKGAIEWGQEVVTAYLDWTMRMNGLGLPVETEIDRDPAEWNLQFFVLFAERIIDEPADLFEADLALVTSLPDEPFGDVAQTLVRAIDVLYFNDPARAPDRPVLLRTNMAERLITSQKWQYADDPARPRVDSASAGIVATMLVNSHNPFSGTFSYLPAALSDRLDPILDPIRPMLPGGPTLFVAICVMNLLMVTPRARHLEFLLDAAETWFERAPSSAFWAAGGIGKRVVDWFETAIIELPTIVAPSHLARDRIDRLFGNLVRVGVAEAHELEIRVEAAAGTA